MIALKVLFIPDEDAGFAWDAMLVYVPLEKRGHLRDFARNEDARRALAGELMARAWLMQRTGLPNTKIKFRLGAHGKPEPDLPGNLHFNLSHSGAWVAAAFSNACPVGVDVQRIRAVSENLAARFFAPDENAALEALPKHKRADFFFRLWTLKESFLKNLGTGLSKPLSSFSIKIRGNTIRLFEQGRKVSRFAFKTYALDPEHKLALCAESGRLPAKPEICSLFELGRAFDPGRDRFAEPSAH